VEKESLALGEIAQQNAGINRARTFELTLDTLP